MIFTKTNRSAKFIIIALFSLLLLFTYSNVALASPGAAVNNPAEIGAIKFDENTAPTLTISGLQDVSSLELAFTNASWSGGSNYAGTGFTVNHGNDTSIVTINLQNNPTSITIPLITTIENTKASSSVTVTIVEGTHIINPEIIGTYPFTTANTPSNNINKGNDEEQKNTLTIINPIPGTLVKIGNNTYMLNVAQTDANGNTVSQPISFAGTPLITITPGSNNAVSNSQVTVMDKSPLTGSTSADGESISIKLNTNTTGAAIHGLMLPSNAKQQTLTDMAINLTDLNEHLDFVLGQHKEIYPPPALRDIPFEMPNDKIMHLSLQPIAAIFDESYEFNIDLEFLEGHSAADELILTAPTGFVWQQTEEIAITGFAVYTITLSEGNRVLSLSFTANADTLEDIALEGLKLMPTADAAKAPINVELAGFGVEANLIVGYYSQDGKLPSLPEGTGTYQNSAVNQQNLTYTTAVDITFEEEHSFKSLYISVPLGFEWINTDRVTVYGRGGDYISSNVSVNSTVMNLTLDSEIDTDELTIEHLALQPTETADLGDINVLLSVGDALTEMPINIDHYEGPPEGQQPEQQQSVNNSVTGSTSIFAIGSTELTLNDETIHMDAAPYINARNQSAYVPLAFFAQAIGIPSEQISWDDTTKTATIVDSTSSSENVFSFASGSSQAIINGESQTMYSQNNVALITEIVKSRTYIPLHPVAELLNVDISWDPNTRSISLEH